MENFFKLKEHGTDVKTEFIAGATTFLSMVYILAVNPSILSAAGMDSGAVFTATAVSACVATLFMAFFANYPVALASGMGLNAYFAFTVCGELAEKGINDPWKIALAAVLFEGIIFIVLSLVNFREKLVNDAVLYHFNVHGYILIGILATWILGMIAQAVGWYQVNPEMGAFSLYPSLGKNLIPSAPYFFEFDFSWISGNIINFLVIVFSFLFVDLFDTVGTLIGVASKGNLLDENGNLPKAKGALMADACGTVLGACLGTSTVTSYVESSAGVANGGRTGLASVVTAGFFLLSLFFAPVFLAIPSFATTPALVWVGLLMMSSIKNMTFDGDIADVFGGFMAVIMMPFTYSIANGIMFGILSWVILKVLTGKIKDIPPVMWIAAALFIIRLYTLA